MDRHRRPGQGPKIGRTTDAGRYVWGLGRAYPLDQRAALQSSWLSPRNRLAARQCLTSGRMPAVWRGHGVVAGLHRHCRGGDAFSASKASRSHCGLWTGGFSGTCSLSRRLPSPGVGGRSRTLPLDHLSWAAAGRLLPEFADRTTAPSQLVDRIELRGLRVGGESVDLEFTRIADAVTAKVLRVSGDLAVHIEG